MTLMEYFNTPETLLPQELIYGQMRVQDAPFVNHQRVVLQLAMALDAHTRRYREGEVFVAPIDVILDRQRALVVQPDILVVSPDRADIVHERIYGAPDLAIEVLSPHPRIGRVDERVQWFAEYGAREVWLYHQPERRLDSPRVRRWRCCGEGDLHRARPGSLRRLAVTRLAVGAVDRYVVIQVVRSSGFGVRSSGPESGVRSARLSPES